MLEILAECFITFFIYHRGIHVQGGDVNMTYCPFIHSLAPCKHFWCMGGEADQNIAESLIAGREHPGILDTSNKIWVPLCTKMKQENDKIRLSRFSAFALICSINFEENERGPHNVQAGYVLCFRSTGSCHKNTIKSLFRQLFWV